MCHTYDASELLSFTLEERKEYAVALIIRQDGISQHSVTSMSKALQVALEE